MADLYISASLAEMAASIKQAKYAALSGSYMFHPIALETLRPINESAALFLNDVDHRSISLSADDVEIQFLFERLYRFAEIQCCLAAQVVCE